MRLWRPTASGLEIGRLHPSASTSFLFPRHHNTPRFLWSARQSPSRLLGPDPGFSSAVPARRLFGMAIHAQKHASQTRQKQPRVMEAGKRSACHPPPHISRRVEKVYKCFSTGRTRGVPLVAVAYSSLDAVVHVRYRLLHCVQDFLQTLTQYTAVSR